MGRGGSWWLVVGGGGWWWLVVGGGGSWWLVVGGGGWVARFIKAHQKDCIQYLLLHFPLALT